MITLHHFPKTEPGPYTWDDFIQLPEHDTRELVDGHLVQIRSPNAAHEKVVKEIFGHLQQWAHFHSGRVCGTDYKVRIRKDRGIMADVLYFRPGHKPSPRALAEGAPDLAVEVICPSCERFDRKVRFEWYQSIGTPEHWIVDYEARLLTRYVLSEGRYFVAGHYDEMETLAPETFPALLIPLEEIFPKIERRAEAEQAYQSA